MDVAQSHGVIKQTNKQKFKVQILDSILCLRTRHWDMSCSYEFGKGWTCGCGRMGDWTDSAELLICFCLFVIKQEYTMWRLGIRST